MIEIAPDIALALVLAAFAAGVIDAIAGGGGLVTVPALLLAGLSPVEALATNKLQGTFGAGTAALSYARAGQVRLRAQVPMAAIAALAGAGGAAAAHLVPAEAMRLAMPLVLIAVAAYFAFKPALGDEARAERLSPPAFALTVVPLVAGYDGLFGPGTGSFFMLGFVMLAGHGVLRATAHTKLLNFASNLGALLLFAGSGSVLWGLGLAMAAGQVAGAALGARAALRVGARLIRPLLVGVSLLLALRLIWQALQGG
jgi:hypothetical protein